MQNLPEGGKFRVTVPAGLISGQKFRVELPAAPTQPTAEVDPRVAMRRVVLPAYRTNCKFGTKLLFRQAQ